MQTSYLHINLCQYFSSKNNWLADKTDDKASVVCIFKLGMQVDLWPKRRARNGRLLK